jgi:hypothetical protein
MKSSAAAIETHCGGDPAVVGELVKIAQMLDEWEQDIDRYNGDLSDLAHEARAILSKVKGGAK